MIKNPPGSAGDAEDPSLKPGSGISPGEGKGNPLYPTPWVIPWTEEPGGLQSMGSKELGTTAATARAHDCPLVVPFSSVQFSSVPLLCLTLCSPMNCSTPGLPIHHHLPEFTQTHGHQVCDAIQPSHPQSSPSPPAPNPPQHQSLF